MADFDRPALVQFAQDSISRGSKSFRFASRLFDRITRERVWLLYAWCRRCDDLADDQDHGGVLGPAAGAQDRLATIRTLTELAFAGEATGDAAFDALGVVAREVTLLPRHWEWLSQQRGGASAALRRLVDEARNAHASRDQMRQAKEASYRFMSAIGGDLPGFEEASRALFAHNAADFSNKIALWPVDVQTYLAWLSRNAFTA